MQDSGWRGAGESGFNSRMPKLAVTTVPAFDDNYLWLVHAPADPQQVVVVDPGDATAVKAALQAQGLVLAGILLTHHHGDHVGGVHALVAAHGLQGNLGSQLPPAGPLLVFGPGNEDIEGITHPVQGGDRVELPALGLSFAVLAVPGHTRGHIAYAGHGAVFCGDTLFSGGCGRLFEGTPAQMHASLGALAALPPETQVYCAHEYRLEPALRLGGGAGQRGAGGVRRRSCSVARRGPRHRTDDRGARTRHQPVLADHGARSTHSRGRLCGGSGPRA